MCRRYNALKLLLKSASSVAPQALRDDAVHIRAAINRRLTPPAADIYSVRGPAGLTAGRAQRGGTPTGEDSAAAAAVTSHNRVPVSFWFCMTLACGRVATSALTQNDDAPRSGASATLQAVASTSSVPAQFMQMLEADLQRISKFVTLQVDDIKLRARALSSRAAAAQTMDELKRIEGAIARAQQHTCRHSVLTRAARSCGGRGGCERDAA